MCLKCNISRSALAHSVVLNIHLKINLGRDIQPCRLQAHRDTTDELTLSPEDIEGVWHQKALAAMVGPGYPLLV